MTDADHIAALKSANAGLEEAARILPDRADLFAKMIAENDAQIAAAEARVLDHRLAELWASWPIEKVRAVAYRAALDCGWTVWEGHGMIRLYAPDGNRGDFVPVWGGFGFSARSALRVTPTTSSRPAREAFERAQRAALMLEIKR